jgi:hypothetical protein
VKTPFDKKAYMRTYNKRDKQRPDRRIYARSAAARKYYCRMAFLRELKEREPCVDCGEYFPHYVMDLDHARGIKLVKVSERASGGLKSFLEELAKCDIVCANCHKIRTWRRSNAD